jgi:6-phosphogluconolactonase (cycloisomerase 2 family)
MTIYRILVASYTEEIYTLEFDDASSPPTLEHLSSVKVGFHPSWITSHPVDCNLVFACLEQEDGKVFALKYTNSDGQLKVLEESSTGGNYPCSVLALKDELFVANVYIFTSSISFPPVLAAYPFLTVRLWIVLSPISQSLSTPSTQ